MIILILFKKYFMESLISDRIPEVDYNITIDNMVMYACIGYIPHSLETAEETCEFMETRLQVDNITSSSDLDRVFSIINLNMQN